MRVLLINPNRSFADTSQQMPRLGLPLGLLSVAACLEEQNFSVTVLDCLISPETGLHQQDGISWFGLKASQIRTHLLAADPDLVGIGCQFSSHWPDAQQLLRTVRETLPQCKIVLGGPHITAMGRTILEQEPAADYAIAGEGERALPQLARMLLDAPETEPAHIAGLIWRDSLGGLHQNPTQVIEDLNQLPLPAYHLVDFEHYFALQQQGLYTRGRHERTVSLITSRGCPYTCTFCSIHLSMGHRWRAQTPEYVVHHMQLLATRYGVRHFQLEDDNFTFNAQRVHEICSGMRQAGLDVSWDTPNGVRADRLTGALIEAMKAAGCVGLCVAAESGDQEVVSKIVHKHIDLKSIEEAARLSQRHGMALSCFFVVGFPGETRRQIARTLRFATRLCWRYHCQPMLNVATPLPGTEMARIAQEKGYLTRELTPGNLALAASSLAQGMIRTEEFDPEYLARCCRRFYWKLRLLHALQSLRHPRLFLSKIRARLKAL